MWEKLGSDITVQKRYLIKIGTIAMDNTEIVTSLRCAYNFNSWLTRHNWSEPVAILSVSLCNKWFCAFLQVVSQKTDHKWIHKTEFQNQNGYEFARPFCKSEGIYQILFTLNYNKVFHNYFLLDFWDFLVLIMENSPFLACIAWWWWCWQNNICQETFAWWLREKIWR